MVSVPSGGSQPAQKTSGTAKQSQLEQDDLATSSSTSKAGTSSATKKTAAKATKNLHSPSLTSVAKEEKIINKTPGKKRKIHEKSNQRSKVRRSRMENVLQDSFEERKSVEVVLSESLPLQKEETSAVPSDSEDEEDQEMFISSKKVKPGQVVSNGDVIDLTGEEEEEGDEMSDLMKF